MSGLWALLATGLLAGPLAGLGFQRTFLSVTVPVKIPTTSNEDLDPEYASYMITIEGKPYTIHLKQKIFVPHDFRIYSYNKEGFLNSVTSHVKNLCFYQGYITGFPKSTVTLSICSGLRGLLQFENISYGIEPLVSAAGFEHMVYPININSTAVPFLSHNKMYIETKGLSDIQTDIKAKSDHSKSFPLYLEIHVIVEKNLYEYLGSGTTIITQKIAQVFGLVSRMFSSFNVTIVLSSLELWTDENKISTTGEVDAVLHRFLNWKDSYLVLRQLDMAYLLVYRNTSDYLGATFPGKMCERKYAGGVAIVWWYSLLLFPKEISLEAFSVVIAQLLGLSMGITYDDVSKCHCSSAVCVMNPEAVLISGVKVFSSCSYGAFESFILKTKGECLQNQPHLDPSYRAPICGNSVMETGEECDCGPPTVCKDNKCCNAATCRLQPGAKCSLGQCCSGCQFIKKGTICRQQLDQDCDVPEYCNGSSAFCQPDLFVQDGRPCRSRTAFCYKGKCPSPDNQCRSIFGKDVENGAFPCYEELNSKTDRSGSCGRTKTGYKLCQWKDLRCGKIICKYKSSKPFFQTQATVIYVSVNGHVCITLDYRLHYQKQDPIWVYDGSLCGFKQICLNRECVDVSVLGFDCYLKCNGHGICNSRKNCHCDPGWLPPDCKTQGPGVGGSIDSGLLSVSDKLLVERYSNNIWSNWMLLIILPLVMLLVMIIIPVIKYSGLTIRTHAVESQSDDLEDYT
ncbi:disintegrin and metalloproteinase domain-containing protein 2 isoform X4 [Ornithorhynchus anatinus]|uniref:disintegrin and metalloproteinase domain-containing protein 2 isoform X4 n=1 Tax=Ornithorhynchus anatinus TaxID=9258 RepID=UPI0010A790B0|nr:disintegrin and metalloproteinase domain-containing protein 2 isoform X4 [Ornithorhynchus anatinus]